MTTNINRRSISGNRVLCQVSLDLPKVNPFYHMKVHRKGYIIVNTRGGSLYFANQFSESSITNIFEPDKSSILKRFTLFPPNSPEIQLGEVGARFLHFTTGHVHVGMVLKFVNLTDGQLDKLNTLTEQLPAVGNNEADVIRLAMR